MTTVCWLFVGAPTCASPTLLSGELPDLIICADSGANHAAAYDLVPDTILGDLDSVSGPVLESFRKAGSRIIEYPTLKDHSDLEIALQHLTPIAPATVRVFGAIGGRLDFTLNNLRVLTAWWRENRSSTPNLTIIDTNELSHLMENETRSFITTQGARVSLLPVTATTQNVSTSGLQWQLNGETINAHQSRTLSNRAVAERITVTSGSGPLLVLIETVVAGAGSHT